MRCDEAFEALSAACDGALAADEVTDLDRHLSDCAACKATATELSTLNRRLRGNAREQAGPPAALERRIRALIEPAPAPRRWPFSFGFALVGATGALAALSIVANATPAQTPRAAGAALANDAPRPTRSGRPCRLVDNQATRSPLGRACADGGLAAARLAMQQMVDRANARGTKKITCGTCHRDQIRFDLRKDARMRLDDLLALAPT
ncbi:MAG TPA: zf-HC2 domain-containing protein [Polyangia bacterium]